MRMNNDTLLDFGANETDSLNKLFQQHGYAFSDELFRVYDSVNKQLWADYENGNIVLEDVLNTRFSETMLRLKKSLTALNGKTSIENFWAMGVSLWKEL